MLVQTSLIYRGSTLPDDSLRMSELNHQMTLGLKKQLESARRRPTPVSITIPCEETKKWLLARGGRLPSIATHDWRGSV